jgi:hypothetical protein
VLHSTGSLKFRKWEIDGANGEIEGKFSYETSLQGVYTEVFPDKTSPQDAWEFYQE